MNLQLVQTQLEEKLAELELRLARIKKDMSQSHSADSVEQASERENDEVLEEIGEETQSAIKDIKSALARISQGSYGKCSSCGGMVNPKRLQALPEAALCQDCAAN